MLRGNKQANGRDKFTHWVVSQVILDDEIFSAAPVVAAPTFSRTSHHVGSSVYFLSIIEANA